MGLDVTAYSRLKLADSDAVRKQMEDDDNWSPWDEGLIQGSAYSSFPASTRGLQGHNEPTPGETHWIGTGWYKPSADTQEHDFRAGSYSYYGAWRDDLATFAITHILVPADPDHLRVPFIELTFFADNEGCIGPDAAADLLADFRRFETEYAAEHGPDDVETYRDFMHACELAADGGLIQFH